LVWQTIPDDRRNIAECLTGERRPMAIEVDDDYSCHSSVDAVLLERRAEAAVRQVVWLRDEWRCNSLVERRPLCSL